MYGTRSEHFLSHTPVVESCSQKIIIFFFSTDKAAEICSNSFGFMFRNLCRMLWRESWNKSFHFVLNPYFILFCFSNVIALTPLHCILFVISQIKINIFFKVAMLHRERVWIFFYLFVCLLVCLKTLWLGTTTWCTIENVNKSTTNVCLWWNKNEQ